MLERKLRVRASPGTGGTIQHRIDRIRKALKLEFPDKQPGEGVPPNRPLLMFDRSCTRTAKVFLDYRYPDTPANADKNAPENPMKKDDHGPEALGRFYAGHFGTNEKHPSRTSQARITRGR